MIEWLCSLLHCNRDFVYYPPKHAQLFFPDIIELSDHEKTLKEKAIKVHLIISNPSINKRTENVYNVSPRVVLQIKINSNLRGELNLVLLVRGHC